MKTNLLPHYTIGTDALQHLSKVCQVYGKKVALIYGEKAFAAIKDELFASLSGLEIVEQVCYGKEATYENIRKLTKNTAIQQADLLLGIGGGKCLDTVKMVGNELNLPVITIATIASTCAAVTQISILYNQDSSFLEISHLNNAPVHCFIASHVIACAPVKYLWAGIGDTMAKHVESTFSARNDELDYASLLGVTLGATCFYPVIQKGKQALLSAEKKEVNEDLEQIIQTILISTGSVSLLVHPHYNSALAHALFYGLTLRSHIEKNHLHGEVVSYGTLVQLMMDNQQVMLKEALTFYRSINLPICLKDLELESTDSLEDVLQATQDNQELNHVPYPITARKIHQAILDLEQFVIAN